MNYVDNLILNQSEALDGRFEPLGALGTGMRGGGEGVRGRCWGWRRGKGTGDKNGNRNRGTEMRNISGDKGK